MIRRLATVLFLVLGAALATALSVRFSSGPRSLPPPSAEIGELAARLESHVRALATGIGPRHVRRPAALQAAALLITDAFRERGYRVEPQEFEAAGVPVANLEARRGGASRPYLVVGAHYDTVPSTPGANDNASGVAVLLEVARLLSPEEAAAVRFVAFVNEEPPWFRTELMGSVVYATRARQRGEQITGMISLETMGYYSDAPRSQQYPAPFQLLFPSTGHFLAAVSNGSSFLLLRRFARAFGSGSPLPLIAAPAPAAIPGVGWSDHWAFWQQGYRGIMLTDTAPYRYPHYHAGSDTPDKLDYTRLAWATMGVAAGVRALAAD